MKLLFIIHSLKFGGTERQLIELIKALDKNRYDIHLICLEKPEERYRDIEYDSSITIQYFHRSNKFDLRPVLSICRYIKRQHIDILHTFESLGSLFGLLSAKLTGRPIVCSAIRDAKDKNYKLKTSKRLIARFADITVSNSYAGFNNRFKTLRPNFKVIYNGMDFSRFKADDTSAKKIREAILGQKSFRHIVGMVASLTDRKDQDTLLEAAPIILKTYPETCFLIVGDGPRKALLTDKAKQLGLDESVIFTGYRADVDLIYRMLDIFLLLSNTDVHFEGISNAIIEAMANKVPVIASKGGGTDEIISDGINGVLVQPKDRNATASAILDFLNNNEKTGHLAWRASQFATKTFDLNLYAQKYESIYNELEHPKSHNS